MVKKIFEFSSAQALLKTVGGDWALGLVKICTKKNDQITDEEIAKTLKLKVTEVRTILNRLHYRGIAEYSKTKNQKTGWCNFAWEINQRRIAELLLDSQKEELEKLEKKHAFEETYMFFGCKKKCTSVPFEVAAEYQFKCPDCSKELEQLDNEQRKYELSKQLTETRQEIEELKKILK